MKLYTIIAVVGTLILYLLFGFFQWELNAGLWSKDLRAMFVLFTVGWLVIAAMIRTGVEEWKK
jgi:hypothetical protein